MASGESSGLLRQRSGGQSGPFGPGCGVREREERPAALRSADDDEVADLKLLIYSYCVGVFSSRHIQLRLTEDIAFRVLAAGNEPNFRTISDFRKIHRKALESLFEQAL